MVGFSLIKQYLMLTHTWEHFGVLSLCWRSLEGQMQSWQHRMLCPLPRTAPFAKGLIGCAKHCSALIGYE